jgi:hypothetical protein
MGWKNVKEHYRIGHIVQVTDKGIVIGSSYMPEIIVISMNGELTKLYETGFGSNEDLVRYQNEMLADLSKLKELIDTPDTFQTFIKVYTWKDGVILEKLCEDTAWPNVTHDGELMYENMFSTNKAQVVQWAKKNVKGSLVGYTEAIEDYRQKMEKMRDKVRELQGYMEKLDSSYPDINDETH